MNDINNLVLEWEDTEEKFLALKEKRDEIERKIYSVMIDNIWRDYKTNTGTHISIIEDEVKDIDWTTLKILLKDSEIQHVTKYSTERKLLIVTKKGKERIRKLIKEGK